MLSPEYYVRIIQEACELPTQRETALHLARSGIAVVPLLPDGSPLIKGGFLNRTHDEATITQKWQKGDYGIGIVPGDHGVIVFDTDSQEALDKIRELRGEATPLMITSTPRGGVGQHIWWPAPEGSFSKKENAGAVKGLDFRHDGGYICIRRDTNSKWPGSNYRHRPQAEPAQTIPEGFIILLTNEVRSSPTKKLSKTDDSIGELEQLSTSIATSLLAKGGAGLDTLEDKIEMTLRKSIGPKIAEYIDHRTVGQDTRGKFVAFVYEKSENKSSEGIKIYLDNLKIFIHSGTLQSDLKLWNGGPWGFGELCAVREGYATDAVNLLKGLRLWFKGKFAIKCHYDNRSGSQLYRILRDGFDVNMFLNVRSMMIEFTNPPIRYDIDQKKWEFLVGSTNGTDGLCHVIKDFLNEQEIFFRTVKNGELSVEIPKRITTKDLEEMLISAGEQHQRDPFLDWLNTLPAWDGNKRIETMLSELYELEDTEYNLKLHGFAMWTVLGGAIRRALKPGCKHDTIFVISSLHQGIGKSSLFRHLFPPEYHHKWFNDSVALTDLTDPKHTVERVGDAVIVEISDNAGSYRAQRTELKSGITRQADRSRLAFRKNTEDIPRRWVAVITSNDPNAVLKSDFSGNRRYLPIVIKGPYSPNASMAESQNRVVSWLDVNRIQIWAEALARLRSEEPTYAATPELEAYIRQAGLQAAQQDDLATAVELALVRFNCNKLTTGEIAVLAGQGPPETFVSGALRIDWFNMDGSPNDSLISYGAHCSGKKATIMALADSLKHFNWQLTTYPRHRANGSRVRYWEPIEPENNPYIEKALSEQTEDLPDTNKVSDSSSSEALYSGKRETRPLEPEPF